MIAGNLARKLSTQSSVGPKGEDMDEKTALAHHLTVVTRNTTDFVRTDVPLINPWEFV